MAEFDQRCSQNGMSFIGRDSSDDNSMLVAQLDHSYRVNYWNHKADETLAGVGDIDHRVIAQGIRLRLLSQVSVAFLRDEFDVPIQSSLRKVKPTKKSVYELDVETLLNLTDEQKNELVAKFPSRKKPGTMGENVEGFAIHISTKKTVNTGSLHSPPKNVFRDKMQEQKGEILTGFICYNLPFISTPLAMLYLPKVKTQKEVNFLPDRYIECAMYLFNQKNYIPVTPKGEPGWIQRIVE